MRGFSSPTSDLLLLQGTLNTYGNSMGWLNSANTGKGASSRAPAGERAEYLHQQHNPRLSSTASVKRAVADRRAGSHRRYCRLR